jgi:hypothetical protein
MSEELASFQSTLLERLSSLDEPDRILATLQQEPLSPSLLNYVQTFSPSDGGDSGLFGEKVGQAAQPARINVIYNGSGDVLLVTLHLDFS